ncbi:MAG: hypothetical protein ACLT1W_04830 [Alistipes onderdonkii]
MHDLSPRRTTAGPPTRENKGYELEIPTGCDVIETDYPTYSRTSI